MVNIVSESAKRVILYAREEGQRFNHEYLSTGHLLLGVLREGDNLGYRLLEKRGFDINIGREELERLIPTQPNMVSMSNPHKTSDAQEALDYAIFISLFYLPFEIKPEDIFAGILGIKYSTCQEMLLRRSIDLHQLGSELMWQRQGLVSALETSSFTCL